MGQARSSSALSSALDTSVSPPRGEFSAEKLRADLAAEVMERNDSTTSGFSDEFNSANISEAQTRVSSCSSMQQGAGGVSQQYSMRDGKFRFDQPELDALHETLRKLQKRERE